MAKTGIASLPKADQRVARSEMSRRTRALRIKYEQQQVLDSAVGLGSALGAAVIDHKFRKGAEGEARFGSAESKFRPQVNAVIATIALLAGASGVFKKYSGTALAAGLGFGGPALYTFTRNQLAK
jgi:hypothetical protein